MRDIPHYMTSMPSHRLAFYKILAERSHRLKFISIFIWMNNVAGDILPLRHTNTRAASPQETRRKRPQKMAAQEIQEIPRSQLGLCRRRRPRPERPSRAGALVPPGPQLDGAVRNGHPEGRPDGALDQPDLAAMSA